MWQSNKKRDSNSHREKGAILFMVAGALVVLLGMAGLALDLGMLYNVRTDLQNAMDAASLAGAWKLDGTDAGITAAVASAQAAANKYHFNNSDVTLNPATEITFSPIRDSGYLTEAQVLASPGTSATIRFVRTTNVRTMDLAMIKVIPGIGSTQAVSAAAVAGQSPPVTTICDGVIPLAPVPQSGGGTMEVYTPGYYYTYRLAPNNDVSDVGSGNYLILDYCDVLQLQGIDCNHGGSTVRDLLSGAIEGCIPLNYPFCTKPGVAAGPVRQGLNDRFDQDTNQTEYTGGTSVTWQHNLYKATGNGKRVFVVPFVSTTQIPPGPWTPFDNGKECPVYAINYGCFFMRERVPGGNGGDIMGEYIGNCNVNGYFDPTAPAPPNVGLPAITKIVLFR